MPPRKLAALLALVLAACQTVPERPVPPPPAAEPKPAAKPAPPPAPKPAPPPREPEPAQQSAASRSMDELRRGVQRYDDGEYQEAARHFQRALEIGLPDPGDEATARKHLAFIACVTKRTSVCRAEFRKAFEADPGFTLAPAEAGHPMWGPVFRSVQAEVAKKRKPAPAAPRR
jgi:hypothetical protein